jgi:hypothetical protein
MFLALVIVGLVNLALSLRSMMKKNFSMMTMSMLVSVSSLTVLNLYYL